MLNRNSMNMVVLCGRLGADAEVKTSKTGNAFVTFSVATDESVKRGENWEVETSWHDCIAGGSIAKSKTVEFMKKGCTVCVRGSLYYRKTEDGHKYTSIRCEDIQVISKPASQQQSAPRAERAQQASRPAAKPAPAAKAQPQYDDGDVDF